MFQVPAASQPSSLFGPEDKEEVAAVPVETKVADERASEKKPVQTTPSPEESNISKKKPAGAVSLFGGINVLGDGAETIKVRTEAKAGNVDFNVQVIMQTFAACIIVCTVDLCVTEADQECFG